MLSNTAVPKYYEQFRMAVLNGDIPINREISMEMNRIDDLIDNPAVYYDDQAVEGWIRFCESELTLTDGSDVHMLDTFKLWGEQIFGWWYFVDRMIFKPNKRGGGGRFVKVKKKKRLINIQYLIVTRSAAKSLYGSFLHSYCLTVNTATTHQITTAPTMKQAEEIISPIKTAISRAKGPLFQFLTEGSINNTTGSRMNRPKLCSTKKGIENFLTNSYLEIRPWSIDKLQGLRCFLATVDEWLSGKIKEDPVNTIAQGAAKNPDWLIVAMSSEGTIRDSVGDSMKMEIMSILKGDYIAPHVSIFYYKLDDISEVAKPEMWMKAQPNIGKTVSYETYQDEVERAENNPSARNDILAKRFGIPMEGYTYFFTYEETYVHRHREFWSLPCAMGADLSQGDDFCAFTFLFPLKNGAYGVKCRSYISARTFSRLSRFSKEKYQGFIDEGSLAVLDGTVLDMMEVYEDLLRFIDEKRYCVLCLGYDPYNAKEFVERWAKEQSPYGIEKVAQGVRTESVPLGELKDMAFDRILLFDEDLMSYAMGNCVVLEDTNGNRKLLKKRHDEKIDNVAALMDAWVAYKLHKDDFM